MTYLANGQLVVIETEDATYLGTAQVDGDALVVRSGFVGRPTVLPVTEVLGVTLASDYALIDEM